MDRYQVCGAKYTRKLVSRLMKDVPGLSKIDFAPPLPSTAHRGKGFDLGLVAILEKPEDVAVYAAHPAHVK